MADGLNEEEQKMFDNMKQDNKAEPDKPEVKPEQSAKPEAKPEAKPVEAKAEEKEQPQKMVPVQALTEARVQNKELRREMDGLKSLISDGDRKLKELLERIEKKADTAPKFEDDPAGNLKHENDQLKKDLEDVRAKIEKQDKANEQAGELSKFKATVDAKEASFAKEHADYWDAAKFLQDTWKDELVEAGWEEADIPRFLVNKAIGITGKAIQTGKDPAQTIYNLAKRVGFGAAKVEEKNPEAKKDESESKLKSIAKGQELAKGGGGGTGPEDSSLASLAQMDNEQLDRLVADKDWWAKNIRRSPLH